jgi:hypothetical protein
MRVIEQLVQHFWARGALTRDDALYLVRHGFVRDADLPGLHDREREINPETYQPLERPEADPWDDGRGDEAARRAEELEDELTGRNVGTKKGGGRKKKPTGHNLAPAAAMLADHFAAREPYPALAEWADRLPRGGPCASWRDAAVRVAAADEAAREAALVGLLNARPRALGELWFWFDLEPLFGWTDRADHAGPVADGLGKLLRAATPAQVGRLGQLVKAPEVAALLDLLAARRAFARLLPVLYNAHFPSLGRWLVPPAGDAAACWPALPWAFVLVYNAREGSPDIPPAGYEVKPQAAGFAALKVALVTAYGIAPVAVRDLLVHAVRSRPDPLPERHDWDRNAVFDRPLFAPFNWKV